VTVGTAEFAAGAETVARRLSDRLVVVNLRTNRIYQLNRTAARLWELIAAGVDSAELQRTLLDEFDVDEARLDEEIAALVPILLEHGLVEAR
jgi:hypothetical protein